MYLQRLNRVVGALGSGRPARHLLLLRLCLITYVLLASGFGFSVKAQSAQSSAKATIASRMSTVLTKRDRQWNAHLGDIRFVDRNPESKGSQIYHALIPDPEAYIRSVAREVMKQLYFSPKDSIPMCLDLTYVLKNDKGISAKSGGGGHVSIFYSTNWVARSFGRGDTAAVDFETRGVLLHELTHAFQLEPQGIGHYGGPNPGFWELVEGMADAVRVAAGGFHGEKDRPKGGSVHKGYRYVGYFLNWVKDHKDKDFIRKMNRSCLKVVPWSWDGAVRYALGKRYTLDSLWHEYQVAVGDVQ